MEALTRYALIASGKTLDPITHKEQVLQNASAPVLSAIDKKISGKFAKKTVKKTRKKASNV